MERYFLVAARIAAEHPNTMLHYIPSHTMIEPKLREWVQKLRIIITDNDPIEKLTKPLCDKGYLLFEHIPADVLEK